MSVIRNSTNDDAGTRMQAVSFLNGGRLDMAKTVRNLTGREVASTTARPSTQRELFPNSLPSKAKMGRSTGVEDQATVSIPMSLRKFRTGSPRRRTVELRASPTNVGRPITRTATNSADDRLSPDRGRLMIAPSPVIVMKTETTWGVGGKPILLMKLKASMVPDTP